MFFRKFALSDMQTQGMTLPAAFCIFFWGDAGPFRTQRSGPGLPCARR